MGRKPRQSPGLDLNTRDRLLNAARKEFDENGYFLTNGDAIARRAGLGHGTFYIYFRNKNEVLLELLRRSATVIPYAVWRRDPQHFLRRAGSPEGLEAIIREMVSPLSEIPGLLKALLQGMLQDDEISSFGRQVGRDIARMFKLMIAAQKKAGGLRGCDAGTLSEIIAVSLVCSILMAAAKVIPCSPESLSRNLCAIVTPLFFPGNPRRKSGRLRMSSMGDGKNIRQALLKSAGEEFSAHGYFETTIAQVAQKSGYSRRTFYHYFGSKDELLKALFIEMLGDLYPPADAQAGFVDTLDTASIRDFVQVLTEIMLDFGTPIKRAFLQGFFNSPELMQVYTDIFARYSEPIAGKLSALKSKGLCRGVDPEVASYIIVATVSYTSYLRSTGFIEAGIPKCALNLGWFLFYFVNCPATAD